MTNKQILKHYNDARIKWEKRVLRDILKKKKNECYLTNYNGDCGFCEVHNKGCTPCPLGKRKFKRFSYCDGGGCIYYKCLEYANNEDWVNAEIYCRAMVKVIKSEIKKIEKKIEKGIK